MHTDCQKINDPSLILKINELAILVAVRVVVGLQSAAYLMQAVCFECEIGRRESQ